MVKRRTHAWIPAGASNRRPPRKFDGKEYKYYGNAIGGSAGTYRIIMDRLRVDGKYYVRTVERKPVLINIKGIVVPAPKNPTPNWDFYIRAKPSTKRRKPKMLHGIRVR